MADTRRYQVSCSIVQIGSYNQEVVRLPKLTQAQVLDYINKQLRMAIRDDSTERFAPAVDPQTGQKRARGSAGFFIGGKIELPETD